MAVVGALATVMCPGYAIYPTVVDPNAVALYLMLPYAVVAIPLLSGKSLSALRLALLAVLTLAYTSLNWSTAFGHGILFCALLAMPAIPWWRLGIYLGMAGLSVGVIGGLSVLDKMSGAHGAAGSSNFLTMLAGYTWGQVGYGADLTTIKAIVRLSAVNCLGLFPLILFTGGLAIKWRLVRRRTGLLAFLPLLAAILGVLTLRNYFGHHPWMAAPMLMPGLVLSAALLLQRNVNGTSENVARRSAALGGFFVAGSLVYALMVLGAQRAYHAEAIELTSFVRQHTARTDRIVLVENLDPQMAAQVEYLADSCDRHVLLLPDLKTPLAEGENAFLLSATNLSGQMPVVAQSEKSRLLALPLIHQLSAWYAQKIARRGAPDRHFDYTTGATFRLYRLPPPAR